MRLLCKDISAQNHPPYLQDRSTTFQYFKKNSLSAKLIDNYMNPFLVKIKYKMHAIAIETYVLSIRNSKVFTASLSSLNENKICGMQDI